MKCEEVIKIESISPVLIALVFTYLFVVVLLAAVVTVWRNFV